MSGPAACGGDPPAPGSRCGGNGGGSEGTRRSHADAVALALRDGEELCVCDLAWITARAENLVGRHLRALRIAGLASSRREHKIVFYTLTDAGRQLLKACLESAEVTT